MELWLDAIRSYLLRRYHPGRLSRVLIASGLFLVLFSTVMLVTTVQAEPLAGPAYRHTAQGAAGGQAIFEEKCVGCHTIGNGKLVGPDLKDVTKRRDAQWIKSFLHDPPKMLASDPIAKQLLAENNNISMPNLNLTDDQIAQLYEFLSNPGAVPAAAAPALPAGAGDPVAGRRLFTGELPLTNGGPQCMACHTVSGVTSLGGGGLGPDLTHVIQRLGVVGVSGALKTIVFPTMMGPFQNRPLTTKEQADLVAFLQESDKWQPPVALTAPGSLSPNALLVFSIALAISVVLYGLLWFFWVRLKKRYMPQLPVRKL